MKNQLYLPILVFPLLIISCNTENNIIKGASQKFAEAGQVVELSPDTNFISGLPDVLNCYGLQVVSDTVLVVYDQIRDDSPCYFKAYSTSSLDFLGSFIRNGRGPSEMIFPSMVKGSSDQKYLTLIDGSIGQAYVVDVQQSLASELPFIVDNFEMPLSLIDWLPLPEGGKFLLELEDGRVFFSSISSDGSTLDTFELDENISSEQSLAYLSTMLLGKSNSGKVAGFMLCLPFLNLFDTQSGEVRSIAVDESYRQWESVVSEMFSMDTKVYYEGAAASSDYILATYKGLGLLEAAAEGAGTSIHVFDWDGNFLYDIKVAENINHIAYDAVGKLLYANDKTSSIILRYDLTELL